MHLTWFYFPPLIRFSFFIIKIVVFNVDVIFNTSETMQTYVPI